MQDLWTHSYKAICEKETGFVVMDWWWGQRYSREQIIKFDHYWTRYRKNTDVVPPEWAEAAARFYLYENPGPMRTWDMGLRSSHYDLDPPTYAKLELMLEPALWHRLSRLWENTDRFYRWPSEMIEDEESDLDQKEATTEAEKSTNEPCVPFNDNAKTDETADAAED